jgi:hydroxyacyl-ACP dehydratase HTD2-like protein with hotdog domain
MKIAQLNVGDDLPSRDFTPTNVSLFMYNAAVWNSHRIHYDERYTTEVEKHPGIVIDGPLQGDWLSQCVLNWIGDHGRMVGFDYSNRRAAYLGETLTTGGFITEINSGNHRVTVEIFVKNGAGEVISPGHATVELNG